MTVHVYVAGPINGSGLQHINIRDAIDVAERLRRGGVVPFVPHLSVAQWAFLHPNHSDDMWLAMDFAWLRKCDALVRIAGESPGSDEEEKLAQRLGIPIYRESADDRGVGSLLSDIAAGKLTPRHHVDRGLDVYQSDAMRTAPHPIPIGMAALGCAGEAGEFADMVKKHLHHGHDLDLDACAKELGDQLWYIAIGARALGLSLSTVAQRNIDKLRERYPDGFDPERSRNRE